MTHLVQTLKWVLAVRGIVAIMFGLAAIFLPELTIQLLILIFGITILVDGFINSIGAIQSRRDVQDWWVYLLEGVFSIVLGCLVIFWPQISGIALLVIIAVWAIVSGIAKMTAAIGLRKLIEGELILLFSGILSVIFGFTMLLFPSATAIAYIAVIGFFSILLGIFLLTLAWRIKQESHPAVVEEDLEDVGGFDLTELMKQIALEDEEIEFIPEEPKAKNQQSKPKTTGAKKAQGKGKKR